MIVNIALLTVTDTRTFDNDKSGAILVEKIKKANHNLIDRKICKDNKEDIVLILKEWINKNDIDTFTKIFSKTRYKPKIIGYIGNRNNNKSIVYE